MPQYTVKSNLKMNGKRYAPGKTVTLDEDAAAPLVENGTLEAPEKKKGEEKK